MKDNTRNGIMRITSTPAGQAPLRIREKWIGLEIPFSELGTPDFGLARGVVSGEPVEVGNCFKVNQAEAIDALRKVSPEAADWWNSMGYPKYPMADWLFNAECAEVVK